MKLTRRRALGLAAAAVPCAAIGRPAAHFGLALLRDRGSIPSPPEGVVQDAARLDTVHAEVRILPGDGYVEALRAMLVEASSSNRSVSIAGARHTMGGQTSLEGGLVVDTANLSHLALDDSGARVTAGAGVRWVDLLAFLEPFGKSVAVMQSNSSFSIGGSMGANAHGWQQDRAPLASTVESFRLMLADGSVARCSRTENRELFALVLGRYGLFGVVLDADLRVVEDEVYVAERRVLDADDYTAEFERFVRARPEIGMAYGRLSVSPESFLREALLTAYRRDGTPLSSLPPPGPADAPIERAIFRGSAGSAYGKRLRWALETWLGGEGGARTSRSRILSEPVSLFGNRDPSCTDVLQEYFVPPRAFAAFLGRMRAILPRHPCDLLNVTVRNVLTDADAFLRYATEPVFSLVLLFNLPRAREADEQLGALERELIDAALDLGGRYYLPYRLHATPEQFARAYPQARAFFGAKKRYDPGAVFQNHFFVKYA